MPKMDLTNARAIAKLSRPENGKQRLYWDEKLTGFGVLVSGKTDKRSFVVQREVNGSTRRVTICTLDELENLKNVPSEYENEAERTRDVLSGKAKPRSMKEVQARASKLLQDMREGKDPKAHRGPDANVTLRKVLDLYLEARSDLAERSRTGYRKSIERWLKDWLDKPLRDITPDMVEDRFRKIRETVKERVGDDEKPNRSLPPGAASANRTMRTLRVLWNFAQDRVPELPPNPVARLRRSWHKSRPRDRHVSGKDLPAFYKVLATHESRTMRDYLLLLLFTGLRRNEAAGLRWEDIDFAQQIIHIPAQRTKAKRKLDLPMSDYVHDLLVARRGLGFENEFVFPGDSRTGHLMEPKKALAEIGKTCGVHVSAHDLRRTFITVASGCLIAPQALKALVNHALGGDVTEDYNQLSTSTLAKPMQIVTDRMKELCQVAPVEGENVTRLPTA